MNAPNLLAFTLVTTGLACFLFGLFLAVGTISFHANHMAPELEPSDDLPRDIRPEVDELLESGPWVFGCTVLFLFGIPAALFTVAGVAIWWWIGRHSPAWTGRMVTLGLRGGGLLAIVTAASGLLWAGLLTYQAQALPIIDEATGDPLRANAYAGAALCAIFSLLSSVYGAGLIGSTFMKRRQIIEKGASLEK